MPAPLQVHTWPTPNGHKVHVLLEGLGLRCEVTPVDIGAGEQFSGTFRSITPNHRILAILDPDGQGGEPLPLFESAAIMIYLAEKTGSDLLPKSGAARPLPATRPKTPRRHHPLHQRGRAAAPRAGEAPEPVGLSGRRGLYAGRHPGSAIPSGATSIFSTTRALSVGTMRSRRVRGPTRRRGAFRQPAPRRHD
jgi:hypothetical protein